MLAEAFTVSDSSGFPLPAKKLSFTMDSIRFDQFKADTAIVETAVSLAQSIQGDIKGLTGEKTMEQKKREFNIITDELYSLIRTVRYDGSYYISYALPGGICRFIGSILVKPQQ